MRWTDKYRLLVLVVLTLAALDYASEVHELSGADAGTMLDANGDAGASGAALRRSLRDAVEQLEESGDARLASEGEEDDMHTLTDEEELLESTESQGVRTGKNCHKVQFTIDAMETAAKAYVEDGSDWKEIECRSGSCVQEVCNEKLKVKSDGGKTQITAVKVSTAQSGDQKGEELASKVLLGPGESGTYGWGSKTPGCMQIKITTGDQKKDEGVNAGVKIDTGNGFQAFGTPGLPLACIKQGESCKINVCAEHIQLYSKGGDGWTFSMYQGSTELAANEHLIDASHTINLKNVKIQHDPDSTGPKDEDTSSPPPPDGGIPPVKAKNESAVTRDTDTSVIYGNDPKNIKFAADNPPKVNPSKVAVQEDENGKTMKKPEPPNADGSPSKDKEAEDPNCVDGKPPTPVHDILPHDIESDKEKKEFQKNVNGVLIAAGRTSVLSPSSPEMKKLNKGDPAISDKIDRLLVLNGREAEAHKNEFKKKKMGPEEAPHEKKSEKRTSAQWGKSHQYTSVPGKEGAKGVQKLEIKSDKIPAKERHWTVYKTPDGREFFRNDATGYAQWHEPVGDLHIKETVVDIKDLEKAAANRSAAANSSSPVGNDDDGKPGEPTEIPESPLPPEGNSTNHSSVQRSGGTDSGGPKDVGNTTTAPFKRYLYQEDKVVKSCCNGMNEQTKIPDWDFLDLNSDGKMGMQATPMECEESCRKYAGCKYFQINPKATSDWCMGFEKCDKQCTVDWKKPSTIFKVGRWPAKPAGADTPTPTPTYKKHVGNNCLGSEAELESAWPTADSAACEKKCDEYGDKCTGFVFPSTGSLANKCSFLTGKLTVSKKVFANEPGGDKRDCYEKVAAAIPWKYVKYEGKQCKGSSGDLLRDFAADTGPEKCELKCTQIGETCGGFVHVRSGNDAGKCHFRQGGLKVDDDAYSKDDRDCYKKVRNPLPLVAGAPVGNASKVQAITVTGGEGGHNGDNGGTNSNGVYYYDHMHNGKPGYKHTDAKGVTYTIRWEEAAKEPTAGDSNWAAVNLAGNKNAWVLKGGQHYRFFIPSEHDTPPQSGWTARTGTAKGTLAIEAKLPGSNTTSTFSDVIRAKPLTVKGASGECGDKINGEYTAQDTMNRKPVYKNSNGFQLRFESALKKDWGAEQLGKNKDVWTFYDGKSYVLFVVSSTNSPPSSGWQKPDAGSCASGVADIQVTENADGKPSAPQDLVVSGGNGGFVEDGLNDHGGLSANGKYKIDSTYNKKPTYKNDNGCVIKFETVDNGDFGAKEIAKGDAWTVNCKGHHRYFHKAAAGVGKLTDFPPRKGWTNRDGTATGSIQVSSGVPTFDSIEIRGAAGEGGRCNGLYDQDGFYNGKPMYKNSQSALLGCTIKFEEATKDDAGAKKYGGGKNVWIIGGGGDYRYFDVSDGPKCPLGGWTKITGKAKGELTLCEGAGCAPPMTVTGGDANMSPPPSPPYDPARAILKAGLNATKCSGGSALGTTIKMPMKSDACSAECDKHTECSGFVLITEGPKGGGTQNEETGTCVMRQGDLIVQSAKYTGAALDCYQKKTGSCSYKEKDGYCIHEGIQCIGLALMGFTLPNRIVRTSLDSSVCDKACADDEKCAGYTSKRELKTTAGNKEELEGKCWMREGEIYEQAATDADSAEVCNMKVMNWGPTPAPATTPASASSTPAPANCQCKMEPGAITAKPTAGFCSDWRYLPSAKGGAYPARLSPGDPLYDADIQKECLNRCEDAFGAGQQAFYIQQSNTGCACSKGSCASLKTSAHDAWQSYTVGASSCTASTANCPCHSTSAFAPKSSDGFCADWRYLPPDKGGAYPARLSASDPLYDADPAKECSNRCEDAFGTGQQAFYLQKPGDKCACSKGACTTLSPHVNYKSYTAVNSCSSTPSAAAAPTSTSSN